MAHKFVLQQIDALHKTTPPISHEFLYHLQRGLLLALNERRMLNEFEFRTAMDVMNVRRKMAGKQKRKDIQ